MFVAKKAVGLAFGLVSAVSALGVYLALAELCMQRGPLMTVLLKVEGEKSQNPMPT